MKDFFEISFHRESVLRKRMFCELVSRNRQGLQTIERQLNYAVQIASPSSKCRTRRSTFAFAVKACSQMWFLTDLSAKIFFLNLSILSLSWRSPSYQPPKS